MNGYDDSSLSLLPQILDSVQCSHLILYGSDTTCLSRSVYHICDTHFTYPAKTSSDTSGQVCSPTYLTHTGNYHEFSIPQIQHSNLKEMTACLKGLLAKDHTFSVYPYSLLVFRDCQRLKSSLTDMLRVMMEKTSTCRFIFLSEHLGHLSLAIQSRCLSLRCSRPQKEPMPRIGDPLGPGYRLGQRLVAIYDHDNEPLTSSKLRDIKEISNYILRYDLSVQHILCEVCLLIGKHPRWTNDKKGDATALMAVAEYQARKAYHSSLHMEALFISLYHELATADDEVDADQIE